MTHPILGEQARALIRDTALEAGRYFEVQILDVDFAPREHETVVTIAVCCERGEKAGSFTYRSMSAWNEAKATIRAIVGDWT